MRSWRTKFICVLLLLLVTNQTFAQGQAECCTFNFGNLYFHVKANAGRITSFKWKDQEFLLSADIEPEYYGAAFWLAPQNKWWPVNATFEGSTYTTVSNNNKIAQLVTETDVNGLLILKKFILLENDTAVQITYQVKNVSNEAKQVAPWELIRTSGGVTFFPQRESKVLAASNLQNVHTSKNAVWYDFDHNVVNQAEKLYTCGTNWIGHRFNDLLFIKSFPDVTMSQVAPGQGEVEVYVNPAHTYIELETHGRYVILKPGETLSYRVVWYLQNFPHHLVDADKEKWIFYVNDFLRKHDK